MMNTRGDLFRVNLTLKARVVLIYRGYNNCIIIKYMFLEKGIDKNCLIVGGKNSVKLCSPAILHIMAPDPFNSLGDSYIQEKLESSLN